MLALFFTFVVVCAVFFAIGFSLGRKTSMLGVSSSVSTASGSQGSPAQRSSGKEGTGKDVSQSNDPGLSKSATANPAASTSAADSKSQSAGGSAGESPLPATTNNGAANGTYFVQVAAVSRQEDAEALVEALKKKQYPAFAANNSPTDKYYHVQVGPYADFKEADAMKTRLIADGYNPIVKK